MVTGTFFSTAIPFTYAHSGHTRGLEEFKDALAEIDSIQQEFTEYSTSWNPSKRDAFQFKLEQFKMHAMQEFSLLKEKFGKGNGQRSVDVANKIAFDMREAANKLYLEYENESSQRNQKLNNFQTAIEGATLGTKLLGDVKDAAMIGSAIVVGEAGFQSYTNRKLTKSYNHALGEMLKADLETAVAKVKFDKANAIHKSFENVFDIAKGGAKLNAGESAAAAEREFKRATNTLNATSEAEKAAKTALDNSKKPLKAALVRGVVVAGGVLVVRAASSVVGAILDSSPAH